MPVESALEHYIKLQDEMELEKQTDDDAQSHQQQQQQAAVSMTTKSTLITDKASSVDALGFAADYKFKVQKIVARPAIK